MACIKSLLWMFSGFIRATLFSMLEQQNDDRVLLAAARCQRRLQTQVPRLFYIPFTLPADMRGADVRSFNAPRYTYGICTWVLRVQLLRLPTDVCGDNVRMM